ncbi:MAG: hypothetical protein M1822_006530 [Bathelium mastoideum]|nr:MAG: hypothetical protein M1822_006530 [Bathelium mastoideum]
MLIKATTELMKNQKHAALFSPQSRPVAIQDTDGRAIFFSISEDGILYLTLKAFGVSQNSKTLTFDIALVLTAEGSDYLYTSLDHAADAWDLGVEWRLQAFDADGLGSTRKVQISNLYIMDIPLKQEDSSHNIFVDVLQDPDNGQQLDRYYIRPSTAPHWKLQVLGINLLAGSVTSCLGKVERERVPGIYTYGRFNNDKAELMFAPRYDAFDPTNKPPIHLFQLPQNSSAIASSIGPEGLTTLFVAAASGLSVYTTNNQKNNAAPKLVVPSSTDVLDNIFAGVTQMAASIVGDQTVVWCVNAQKSLFYVSCLQGSEGDRTAWSVPVPQLAKVDNFGFYINRTLSNNVLFANSSQGLVRLTQDPSTSLWKEYRILLPAPDIGTLREMETFTSHIEVFNDDGAPAIGITLSVRANGLTSVYIDGTQYSLDPQVPVKAVTGSDGTLTVVQQTTILAAVCFEVKTLDGASSLLVDPSGKAMQRLSAAGSGQDLRAVRITDERGNTKPLIPSDVPQQNSDAAASAVQRLLAIRKELPPDGTTQENPISSDPGTLKSFVVDYSAEIHVYSELEVPPEKFGPGRQRSKEAAYLPRFTEGGLDYIKTKLGNLLQWVGDAWQSVTSFAVNMVNGYWYMVVEIAGEVWGAVLNCVAAVSDVVEFVFNKIKVVFEDIISWLGAVLGWNDIVRTHKVIKNIIKQHAAMLASSFDLMEKSISSAFEEAENQISAWAGLTGPQTTVGEASLRGDGIPDSNNPQSHWAVYHTKNGIEGVNIDATVPSEVGDEVKLIVDGLEKILEEEKDNLKEALLRVKNEVASQFTSLSAIQTLKRLAGIVGILIAEAAETAIIGILDIAKLLVQAAVSLLEKPIDIPIISPLYKRFAGEDLSILDLMCLIGAIPATIIYKAMTGNAPFADDTETNALIDSTSFTDIISILQGTGDSKPVPATSNGQPENKQLNPIRAFASIPLDGKVLATLNIASSFDTLIYAFANLEKFGTQETSKNLNMVAVTSYYVHIILHISSYLGTSTIWTKFDQTWTVLAASNALISNLTGLSENPVWIENISPFLESLLHVVWIAPTVGIFVDVAASPKNSDIEAFVSRVVSDLAGTCTFLTSVEYFPEVAPFAAPIICGANVASGAVDLLTGVAYIGSN